MAQKISPDVNRVQQASSAATWYQALTLPERLNMLRACIDQARLAQPDDPELAERRLQKWQQQAPFAQDSYFAERLAREEITEAELRYLLGEAPTSLQARIAEPPAWLLTLEQILSISASTQDFAFLDAARSGKPALFLNALKPFIKYGLDHFQQGVEQLVAQYQKLPFQPETSAQLFLPALLNSILATVLKTFTMELNIARLQGTLAGETPEERFADFVRQLAEPAALRVFFERYPVLARDLLTVTDHWVAYSLEFLSHLCADWQEICARIALCDPGVLQEAHMGAGDTHRQGRSVIRLTFSSGFKLIYKPRSLCIDTHFYQLLHWLNEQGIQPAFRSLHVIERGEYGWVEYVESQTCHSKVEVARFYERLGGYLAVLYALGANDFHLENLIASGEHPMLIDLESVIAPQLPQQPSFQSQGAALFQNSVMRIGLLPVRVWGNDEAEGIDISGLGGKDGQLTPHQVSLPDEIGTDQMRIIRQRVQMHGAKNQPTLNDDALEFLDYQDQLLHGFASVYRLLLRQREIFLVEMLPLFEHDVIRVIPRSTRIYASVLQESLHPTLLHNALLRDRFFDQIWQSVPRQPFLARIIPAELADLRVNDIPFFTSRPGSRHIYTSRGECLADVFAQSALENITRRVRQFDEQDLARQTWLIRASFATVSTDGEEEIHERQRHVYQQAAARPATRERLLQAARVAGDRLCELALPGQDEISWLGLYLLGERDWRVLVGGVDLYNGQAGIALFLAYLGEITQEARYTDVARVALSTIQRQIATFPEQLSLPGAFYGWGAILHLYTHLGELWGEQALFKEAQQLVERFATEEVKDEAFNLLTGAAGGILSLLNLYRVAPTDCILQTAVKYGDHLLAHAVPLSPGCGWIEARLTRPLTGLARGAGGIALSLFALADASGEERFRQAALDALAYERGTFSSQEQNWPDMRAEETEYMTAWCQGAPGIALARLATLPYHDDATVREEIAVALQTTLTRGFGYNHSLCHGDLGNLEAFLCASMALVHSGYQAEVERLTALVLEDIEQNGWRTGTPQSVETPGMMVGIAGIGYELLRLSSPERVPSILSLAAPHVSQPTSFLQEETLQ